MTNTSVYFDTSEFAKLCRSHNVKEIYAFGSIVNGNFTDQSDIDLLVDIDDNDPLSRGELLLSIWDKFETYFNRKVDLLTPNSLRNPYLKKSIDETKKLVYNRSKEEIL